MIKVDLVHNGQDRPGGGRTKIFFRYAGQVEMAVQDTLIEGRARDKGGEFVCKDGLTTRPATSWLEPQGVLLR